MALREKSEKILKDSIRKMKEDKAILIRDLNDVVKELNNLQARKINLQGAIDDINVAINNVQEDIASGGIPG